jgi:hypothetical protein
MQSFPFSTQLAACISIALLDLWWSMSNFSWYPLLQISILQKGSCRREVNCWSKVENVWTLEVLKHPATSYWVWRRQEIKLMLRAYNSERV